MAQFTVDDFRDSQVFVAEGDDVLITNAGLLVTQSGTSAIYAGIGDDDVSVTNYGIIASGYRAFYGRGSNYDITNHGSMTTTADTNAVIWINSANNGPVSEIENYGSIMATGATTRAIRIRSEEIDLFNDEDAVIVSTNYQAIVIENSNAGHENTITNDGLISTNGSSHWAIKGDIGQETVINSGRIIGVVDLGTNDDNYQTIGNGRHSGFVDGSFGDDSLTGGNFRDIFYGGEDNDTLRGYDNDDVLRGGSGEDKIVGGAGNDTLSGGAGKDQLIGGGGSDVFEFFFENDSPNDSNRDVIKGFTRGSDKIDLSDFAGVFDFIQTNGFSGDGDGEVRWAGGSGDPIRVLVDLDGDGSADMRIIIDGPNFIGANDFDL